ncbi:flagellar hook-length control protein FliK, partial [uncultured Bartonella sp.]|uniref:flagellar hook-length control protein FliK n=1 Tax=uncultured Bartonella sp. TaxID=104108 RepID=UPI002620608C
DKVHSDDKRHEKADSDKAASKTDKSANADDKKLSAKDDEKADDKNDEAVSTLANILVQWNATKDAPNDEKQLTLTLDKSNGEGEVSLGDEVDSARVRSVKNAIGSANDKNGLVGNDIGKMAENEGLLAKKLADSIGTDAAIGGDVKNSGTQSEAADKIVELTLNNSRLAGSKIVQETTAAAKGDTNGASNNLLDEVANASQLKMPNATNEDQKTRDKDGKNTVAANSEKTSESKISAAISELKEMNNRNGSASDDVADNSIGRNKSNNGRRVLDSASQSVSNSTSQANPDNASNKVKTSFDVGSKVGTDPANSQRLDVLGRIADVEVLQNRSVGDMRVLRIKLNPENLGTVEAKLRKTNEGLNIELHAERQETARLLAADHHMLGKALEKSGFNDDGRLTIMVVDRSAQNIQQAHSSNSGQGMSQDNSGQNFNGQRQSNGQQSQGGHNGSGQAFTEFPFTGTPLQDDKTWEEGVYRNSGHLVV